MTVATKRGRPVERSVDSSATRGTTAKVERAATIESRPVSRVLQFLWSGPMFCIQIAVLMVALRLVLFDSSLFSYYFIPNHDMSQGIAFFATSMHSMRLTGDIAWWNPIDRGYAPYFQSFLSPLAPTTSHIVFIIWAQGTRLLSLIGIAISEYTAYLSVNYLALPFLTYLSLSAFLVQIFRHRTPTIVVLLVYTLSGIGLWNTGWFYFQESFSLFFLFAAALAALNRPTHGHLAILAGAVIVQVSSVNYWTIYNSWFIIIVLGLYAIFFPHRVRNFFIKIWNVFRQHPRTMGLLSLSVLAVMAAWLFLITLIVQEQASSYTRPGRSYDEEIAARRVIDMWRYTGELFNPSIRRALEYSQFNALHNARYIGAFLLPLLALVPFYRWSRRDAWLAAATLLVLIVCLAPSFLIKAWAMTPGMDRVQHFFYFYTHHFQFMVVLMAGLSLDNVLNNRFDRATWRFLRYVLSAVVGVAAALLLGQGLFGSAFDPRSASLQANLRLALLLLLSGVIVLQLLLSGSKGGSRRRALLLGALLILAYSDLSRYFVEVSERDRLFTSTLWVAVGQPPLPEEAVALLARPWPEPDHRYGFDHPRRNLPGQVSNLFWPTNSFMLPNSVMGLRSSRWEGLRDAILGPGPMLAFYDATISGIRSEHDLPDVIRQNPEVLNRLLVLEQTVSAAAPDDLTLLQAGAPQRFECCWLSATYNEFAFDVTAPRDGWLVVRQLYDPHWQVWVDGVQVIPWRGQFLHIAVPITQGTRRIEMSYRPLSRLLYWPAVWILEAVLGALAAAWLLNSTAWRPAVWRSGPLCSFGRPETPIAEPGAPSRSA